MERLKKFLVSAGVLILLSTRLASADDLLFTNFVGEPFGGTLWTSGGDCASVSCYALRDNFEAEDGWNVTGFVFYIVSPINPVFLQSGGRFAVLTAAGAQTVAPTNTALTVTDMGNVFDVYNLFKMEITGLDIDLDAGEYTFGFTNTNEQGIYPGYGTASVKTISPGFQQLSGSAKVESLLSTTVNQLDEDWAFQVIGTEADVDFKNGFETP